MRITDANDKICETQPTRNNVAQRLLAKGYEKECSVLYPTLSLFY